MTTNKILNYKLVDKIVFKIFGTCHACGEKYTDSDFQVSGSEDWGDEEVACVTCLHCKSSASVFAEKVKKTA